MQNNSAQLSFSSFIWRFLERCGAQGVSFIVSVILARLLAPSAFGTISLVTVFTAILDVFVRCSLGTALIQKKDADNLDYSSVFYCNLTLCTGLYLLLFFAAPLIAAFYNEPTLTPIVRVMGLSLIFSGVNNVQGAYISRHLLFRKTFFSTLIATVFSAIVGVYMAYAGYGVWALVAQGVTSSVCTTAVIWITVPWRPKWLFSFARLRGLFSFGWKLLVSGLMDTVYNNMRSLIIGKVYSSDDLAFYNKGKSFPYLVVSNINASIDSVLFPTMSQAQENPVRVKAMTRRAIRTSTYIMAPLMIGLAVCAEPVIRLLLTEKWLDATLFMRIFCISYLFYPIHTSNLNAIKAMGRSDMFLKLEIAKKIVGLILVLATMFISVKAMAYSLLVSTLLSTIINAYPNKKLLNYSWAEQMKDILPNLLLAVVMAVPVFFLQFLPLPTIVILAMQVLLGVGLYVGLSVILKAEIFHYLLSIIKGFIRKKKSK